MRFNRGPFINFYDAARPAMTEPGNKEAATTGDAVNGSTP